VALGTIAVVRIEQVENVILFIWGNRVMLDKNLAELYDVETRTLVQAIKRNKQRFPPDFMFQLSKDEFDSLRSQIVISKGRGGRRYLPYVFTEQGVAMLSSVLHSDRAIQVNIAIMRVFARLREMMATHKELARQLSELEKHLRDHDHQIQTVFEAIRQLMAQPDPPKKKIGFMAKESKGVYGVKKTGRRGKSNR
jgi:phage regulator Rha-like protein